MIKKISKLERTKNRIARITGRPEMTKVKNAILNGIKKFAYLLLNLINMKSKNMIKTLRNKSHNIFK